MPDNASANKTKSQNGITFRRGRGKSLATILRNARKRGDGLEWSKQRYEARKESEMENIGLIYRVVSSVEEDGERCEADDVRRLFESLDVLGQEWLKTATTDEIVKWAVGALINTHPPREAEKALAGERSCPGCGAKPLVEEQDRYEPRDAVCSACGCLTWSGSR